MYILRGGESYGYVHIVFKEKIFREFYRATCLVSRQKKVESWYPLLVFLILSDKIYYFF